MLDEYLLRDPDCTEAKELRAEVVSWQNGVANCNPVTP
jgi:hypothetical protein